MQRSEKRRKAFGEAQYCTDVEFLADCCLDATSRDAKVALCVREIIADLAGIQKEAILARHTFMNDLAGLNSTLDSLDAVEYLLTLEERLGVRLPSRLADGLPGISDHERFDPSFTVGRMAINTAESISHLLGRLDSGDSVATPDT